MESDNFWDIEAKNDEETNAVGRIDKDDSFESDEEDSEPGYEESSNPRTLTSVNQRENFVANQLLAGSVPAQNVFGQSPGLTEQKDVEDSPLSIFSVSMNASMN